MHPAIFCEYTSCDPDNDPAVSLVLHGRQQEAELVAQYLETAKPSACAQLRDKFDGEVTFDPIIDRTIDSCLPRSRDRHVVRSLLAGACFLRSTAGQAGVSARLHVSLEHYTKVYAFDLESQQTRPNDNEWTGAEIRSCCRLAALLDVPLTVPLARPGEKELLEGLIALTDAIADQAHDRFGVDCLLDETNQQCECELSGPFYCGVPGILAHLEDGQLAADAKVERCDLCQRYPSDAAALEKLQELGYGPS